MSTLKKQNPCSDLSTGNGTHLSKNFVEKMEPNSFREENLQRLSFDSIKNTNQHYIVTYFIKNDIQNAIEGYAKGSLLDIGCGNKPYSILFNNRVTHYVGCDIVQSSANVVDYLCPANQLCFSDNSFDTVFSTQVLEHVADCSGMIKEAFRVLKTGGHAIFTAPFAWELHEEPYDFFRFSKHGLRDIFEKNGFEVLQIKANGGKWSALLQLTLNVLFSTRRYNTIRSRLIKLVFIHLRFIILYNKFSIWLDRRFFDDIFTLNYLIVAKKNLR